MKRKKIYISLVAISCLTIFSAVSQTKKQLVNKASKPNIIVILTDDQGYADLGLHGSVSDIKTPNLDALANTGVRFTNGYVTAPQCSPSRAGLLTGKYQQLLVMNEISKGLIPLAEITLAERLKKVGYKTGMVGKWHLDPNAKTGDWAKEFIPNIKPYGNELYAIPEEMKIPYLPHNRGFQQIFYGQQNSYLANYDLKGNLLNPDGEKIDLSGYRLDIQTDAALAFIKRNSENPFFLYLAYYGPHVPLESTEKYLDCFPGKMAERRRYGLSMISAIDDGVGKIMETLKRLDIDENTMVIFTSDNGAPLGITMNDLLPVDNPKGAWDGSLNTPFLGEKGMLTEGGIHVPFIINYPKLPKGQIYKHPISSLDIAATAVDLAGIENTEGLDGVSLMSYLSGVNKDAPHDYLFWRFWQQSAVRSGKWKYIQGGTVGSFLFDLDTDPEEKTNIIDKHPEIAERLKKELYKWGEGLQPAQIPEGELGREKKWFGHYLHFEKN